MAQLSFKEGVSLRGMVPQMLVVLRVVEDVFSSAGLDTVVTSANDGEHSFGSYHYLGRAFDFRTHHAAGIAKGMAGEIRKRLAPLGFDVILEDEGQPNEHLHIELDKGKAGY